MPAWGVRTWVALIITALWAVGYIVALITSNYTGIAAVTPVMLVAAGYLLSADIRRNGNGGTKP